MSLLISEALADGAAAIPTSGSMVQIAMLGVFVLIFWLMIWRPQSKRAKEHKQLLSGLTKGDEAMTSGGILGKVIRVTDEYITLQISAGIDMNFQKSAIVAVVPKGTIKAIAQTSGAS